MSLMFLYYYIYCLSCKKRYVLISVLIIDRLDGQCLHCFGAIYAFFLMIKENWWPTYTAFNTNSLWSDWHLAYSANANSLRRFKIFQFRYQILKTARYNLLFCLWYFNYINYITKLQNKNYTINRLVYFCYIKQIRKQKIWEPKRNIVFIKFKHDLY